jgi:haloalkane dehalogenase
MMKIIRTPEKRFEKINDFPYEPKYLEINGFRIHYVDEGEGETILALHGEPTWSYLYRKFIPVLKDKYRFIAVDLAGFGKSDKATKIKDYTFHLHFDILEKFVESLKLGDITLVCQDWGGLLGLSLVGKKPELFKRLVIMNTFLPIGDRPMPKAFKLWKAYAKWHPTLPIAGIVKWGSIRKDQMTKEIKYAYNAPFPGSKYKAGARAFPKIVPHSPDDEGVPEMKKAREVLSEWKKPCLVMFSDKDPIMRPARKFFLRLIPSAPEQEEILIRNAGHFLQEDAGEEIAENIDKFMKGKLRKNTV